MTNADYERAWEPILAHAGEDWGWRYTDDTRGVRCGVRSRNNNGTFDSPDMILEAMQVFGLEGWYVIAVPPNGWRVTIFADEYYYPAYDTASTPADAMLLGLNQFVTKREDPFIQEVPS